MTTTINRDMVDNNKKGRKLNNEGQIPAAMSRWWYLLLWM